MLDIGTKAPDFSLPDQNGETLCLSDLRGRKVVLYFYPKAYDVWKEKNNYGRITMGVVRTTYLIDEEGVIVKAFGKVKAAENPAQMLDAIEEEGS